MVQHYLWTALRIDKTEEYAPARAAAAAGCSIRPNNSSEISKSSRLPVLHPESPVFHSASL